MSLLIAPLLLGLLGSPAEAHAAAPPSPGARAQVEDPDAAFTELTRDFGTRCMRHDMEARVARENGEAFDKPHPASDVYAKAHELARRGSGKAVVWCLEFSSRAGLKAEVERERRRELLGFVASRHVDEPFVATVLEDIQGEARPGGAGRGAAAAICRQLHEGAMDPARRRVALLAQGRLLEGEGSDEARVRAIAVYREVSALYPDSPESDTAQGRILRGETLRVGQTATDFTAMDTRGRRLQLSELRGKVVLLFFFGFDSQPSRAAIPGMKELFADLRGQPFELVGVNSDGKRQRFDRQAMRQGVTWRTAFEGTRGGPIARQFGVTTLPSCIVLDAEGAVLRVSDGPVDHEALRAAIDAGLAALAGPGDAPLDDEAAEREAAELEQRYEKLAARFQQQLQRHTIDTRKGEAGAHPAEELLPEFEALARDGHPMALLWLVRQMEPGGVPRAEASARSRKMLEELVREHPNEPVIELVVGDMPELARRVGRTFAYGLLEDIAREAESKNADLRARTLYQHAWMLEASAPSREVRDEVRGLLRALTSDHPGSRLAGPARDRLAALERVVIGEPMPDSLLVDREGQGFSLEDLRGQVVVLAFWDPGSRGVRRLVAEDRRLVEAFGEKGLTYISLRTDRDPRAIGRGEDRELGRSVPLGGRDAALCREWGLRHSPTRFVLDREGVLRRILFRGPVASLVEELLSESPDQR